MSTDKKDFFPKLVSTTSFWLTEQSDFSRFRSTKELPQEVDTLIIGSGYTGTSVAYNLMEEDPTRSVAMFEARNLCAGATGRNGGHLKPYYHRSFYKDSQRFGEKRAADIVNFEYDTIWALKDIADKHQIDCDLVLCRTCDVYPYKNDPDVIQHLKGYDMLMKSKYVYKEIKRDIQVFYGDAAKTVSSNPNANVAITYLGGSCWPWKLVTGLLRLLVQKGLNLQANTLITDVSQRSDGKWVVKTSDRGETICTNVVYATNGYTKALIPEASNVIMPHKGVAVRIVAKDGKAPYLSNTYSIFSPRRTGVYLIHRPDGSIIVGGKCEYMYDLTKKGKEAVKEQFDQPDDSYVVDTMKEAYKDYMAKNFSTWEKTPEEVSHYWSGIMGFTNDSEPYVGEMDSIGKKNAYIAAGFGGHGMPRIWLSGRAVALCISQGKSVKEIPYTVPKDFMFTKERFESKQNNYADELLNYTKKLVPEVTSLFQEKSKL